jgi:hypothetical protein
MSIFSILGDIAGTVRAGIQPAVAARVGYLQGQDQQTDKNRQVEMQNKALERQAVLDQIKASLDASTVHRNEAYEDWLNRRISGEPVVKVQDDDGKGQIYVPRSEASGRAVPEPPQKAAPAPKTMKDAQGALQYDPATGTWKRIPNVVPTPTGPGSRGGSRASQNRLNAQSALDRALKQIPHPSKEPSMIDNPAYWNAAPGTNTRGVPTDIPNPKKAQVHADSIAYERNVLEPLRKRLYDVTEPDLGLSGKAAGGQSNLGPRPSGVVNPSYKPDAAAREAAMARDEPTAAPTSAPPPRHTVSPEVVKSAQAEFDAASRDLQMMLSSPSLGAPEKKRAQQIYEEKIKSIASKYGLTGAR